MSFTEKTLPYSRQKHFAFFATGATTMAEEFAPGNAFELEKIRLRLSSIHASVVDFTCTLSHHIGSQYNQNLLSYAMVGAQDVELRFNPTLKLFNDDTIDCDMIMSAANVYGLEISGWAITG